MSYRLLPRVCSSTLHNIEIPTLVRVCRVVPRVLPLWFTPDIMFTDIPTKFVFASTGTFAGLGILPNTYLRLCLDERLSERSIVSKGSGAVYSFDPVGSYERETCRAAGAAQQLVQPFLDNQVRISFPLRTSLFVLETKSIFGIRVYAD